MERDTHRDVIEEIAASKVKPVKVDLAELQYRMSRM